MTLNGIDVSNNNTVAVNLVGVDFLFRKATEGVTFVDRTQSSWTDRVDIDGPYHFAHPDQNTPEAEAGFFLRHAIPGAMWALDCETRQVKGVTINPLSIMGAGRLSAWCDRFYEIVAAELGPNGYHYTFRSYAVSLWPRLTQSWRWWLATLDGEPAHQTYAGRTVDIEQFAIVGGIDRNVAYTEIRSASPSPGDDMTPEEHQWLQDVLLAATQAKNAAESAARNASWVAGTNPADGTSTGHGVPNVEAVVTDVEAVVTDLAEKVDALAAKVATMGTGTGALGGQASVTIDLKPQS